MTPGHRRPHDSHGASSTQYGSAPHNGAFGTGQVAEMDWRGLTQVGHVSHDGSSADGATQDASDVSDAQLAEYCTVFESNEPEVDGRAIFRSGTSNGLASNASDEVQDVHAQRAKRFDMMLYDLDHPPLHFPGLSSQLTQGPFEDRFPPLNALQDTSVHLNARLRGEQVDLFGLAGPLVRPAPNVPFPPFRSDERVRTSLPPLSRSFTTTPYSPMLNQTPVDGFNLGFDMYDHNVGHALARNPLRSVDTNTEDYSSSCKSFGSAGLAHETANVNGPQSHVHSRTGFPFDLGLANVPSANTTIISDSGTPSIDCLFGIQPHNAIPRNGLWTDTTTAGSHVDHSQWNVEAAMLPMLFPGTGLPNDMSQEFDHLPVNETPGRARTSITASSSRKRKRTRTVGPEVPPFSGTESPSREEAQRKKAPRRRGHRNATAVSSVPVPGLPFPPPTGSAVEPTMPQGAEKKDNTPDAKVVNEVKKGNEKLILPNGERANTLSLQTVMDTLGLQRVFPEDKQFDCVVPGCNESVIEADLLCHFAKHFKALGLSKASRPCPCPVLNCGKSICDLPGLGRHLRDHHLRAQRMTCRCGRGVNRRAWDQVERHLENGKHDKARKELGLRWGIEGEQDRGTGDEAGNENANDNGDNGDDIDDKEEGSSNGAKRRRLQVPLNLT